MHDPYENLIVGNFLYALGLLMGQRSPDAPVPGNIALLQQTPLDPLLGDVLIQYPNLLRLIEFKRYEMSPENRHKEHAKLVKLRAALTREPQLKVVSQAVHWYVRTHALGTDAVIQARPYLDLKHESRQPVDMLWLAKGIVDEAHQPKPAFSAEQLQRYLDVVITFVASGRRNFSASGLLIAGNPATGGLRYAFLDDILDLRLTRSELMQSIQRERVALLQLNQDQSVRRERVQEHTRTPTQQPRLGR
jgi:hypothetical protein